MITMRPGYETLDYHGRPYRHATEMRRPQVITEHLANGWTLSTAVDGADLEAASQSSRGPGAEEISASLQRALDSGDPALALRARQLQLLILAAR
jgi:hypothetical protein